MKIEVLGTGCPKCMSVEQNVKKALAELAVQADVEKVTDIQQIIQRGVMSTPALVIDGKVVLQGKNPTVDQLKHLIKGPEPWKAMERGKERRGNKYPGIRPLIPPSAWAAVNASSSAATECIAGMRRRTSQK